MFNTYIELIISLIVIYALLSVLVSLLNELYRNVTRDRGKMMYAHVRKMLIDEKNLDITYLIYRHPLIENARRNDSHSPSYIEPKIFATAFIETIGDLSTNVTYKNNNDETFTKTEKREVDPLTRFELAVAAMHDGPLKNTLRGMAERAELDKENKYLNLENQVIDWFNYQMRSLTSAYRAKQRKSLLFFGFVITIFLNVDSLHLVHELRNDPKLRVELSSKAEKYALSYKDIVNDINNFDKDTTIPANKEALQNLINIVRNLNETKEEIDDMELPIGYSKNSAPISWFNREKDTIYSSKYMVVSKYDERRNKPSYIGVIFYFFGIIITGFSLSMGAPFWFDLLNKAVNIRRSGK